MLLNCYVDLLLHNFITALIIGNGILCFKTYYSMPYGLHCSRQRIYLPNFRSIRSLSVIGLDLAVARFACNILCQWIKRSDFSLEHSVLTSLYSQFWQSDQHATLRHNLKYFKLREWRVKYRESFKNFVFMSYYL